LPPTRSTGSPAHSRSRASQASKAPSAGADRQDRTGQSGQELTRSLSPSDAASAAEDAQGLADDLYERVADLESIDPYDLESRLSTAESRIDEACNTLSLDLDTFGC